MAVFIKVDFEHWRAAYAVQRFYRGMKHCEAVAVAVLCLTSVESYVKARLTDQFKWFDPNFS